MRPLTAAQARRVDTLEKVGAALREAFPGQRVPYFAHLRLDTGLRETDVLLGRSSHTAPALSVIDWQTAPLAEVFFTCDEGDEYEIDVGGRLVTGRVLQRHLLGFEGERLVRVDSADGELERDADGDWRPSSRPPLPALPRRPLAARRPFRSPLEVTLDPAQQRVVDLPPEESVLLLGEAGFGKTTVALHRLMALKRRFGRHFKAGVLVPTEGLRRLTSLMLERRGVEGVEVWTYERWAAATARRVFRELPHKESVNATTSVLQLKRHRALRPVLEAFARARPRAAREEGRGSKGRLNASRADLEHLFGDRDWMAKVVERAGGTLYPRAVAEVAEHTRIQFLDTTEAEYGHVDAERLETVDGRRIDEGTPTEDVRSVDAEDYAVLFELERLRAVQAGQAPHALGSFDCLVIDEAQEFAPLELSLMGRSLKRGGSLVVAGDAAQQVDPTASFGGWEQVLADLGKPSARRCVLEVNYRCPPDVTALARGVLEGGGRARLPEGEPSVTRVLPASPFHLAAWLTEGLRALAGDDPTASIAVICRSADAARSLARVLRHGPPLHLALDGHFEFQPGVIVTCVQEVKGLEFDHVVVPDASAQTYPDTQEARRGLYVAVTRATHRLTLAAAGEWSPLVR